MDDKDLEQLKATEISEVNPITKELEGISDLFKNLGKQLTSAYSLFSNDYGQSLKEALSATETTKLTINTPKSVELPNIPTYDSETDEGTWITITAEDAFPIPHITGRLEPVEETDDSDDDNYNRRRR